ncbi:hypothetical protein T4A_485, partial [Trichinella pseudospiralis]
LFRECKLLLTLCSLPPVNTQVAVTPDTQYYSTVLQNQLIFAILTL